MFRKRFLLVLLLLSSGKVSEAQETTSFGKYVNPFIGTTPVTDSAILGYRLPDGWRPWSGLVFPGSSLPNAMVQLSPITEYGSGAGYEYEDTLIYGFTHTNKGHWNLCNIPVLPFSGTGDDRTHVSRFSHGRESASPAYYQVYLEDYKINVQLTSTLRCGYHRYEYGNNVNRKILFDLARANNRVTGWMIDQVDPSTVKGYQVAGGDKIYFYAVLNKKIAGLQKIMEGAAEGRAIVDVADGDKTPVELRIGLSFVSTENARENLEQEIGQQSFDAIRKTGAAVWEKKLSAIQVKGGTEKQRQLFYSSLYRSLLWPALRSDVNGEYTDVKKQVVKAAFNYYTIPSLWDTYRNKDVLLSIVSPDVALDVIRSLKDIGDKTGFIPTFFHGDHAASTITGAYLRGIRNFDVKDVYRLLLRNATVEGGTRPYIKEYMERGYVSEEDIAAPHVETKAKAGVSKTLEYAYDDYSLALLAKALGDSAHYKELLRRSGNYRNVFDPTTRFMRGKLENGQWVKNFNPEYPYYEYMYREANAWQLSFYVPHDMQGLIGLYGGEKPFEEKLDSFFTLPWNPTYIARNVETMIGQYCHGNQPDHEAPYAYYFIGKPEKSQKIIDRILNELYGIGKEGLGLSGMDDAGEMSAWYVWNALGLYAFSASDPEYIVTVPLFDEVKWRQENGKSLIIKKSGTGRRLRKVTVDKGTAHDYFVGHDCFVNGAEIRIHTN
ncbi:GH92 family glycosyl hydrolase [Niabella beijingensis]|uniref:GH92 family glycosyl hydrolase n=1 Tax=Niabella beijingensis TaxID=2872700 RepID=UPI001CBECD29|nr:GH92 family glycosyl hydrolase [Niabella beijingensis]MBZ4191946.1 GH92 family glycosyl hydrolase [Niabella beijingensis]